MLKIDLHGQLKEEARINLISFFKECEIKKVRHAAIIHGNGKFVLKRLVDEMILENNYIKSSSIAHPSIGGSGTTIIEFKKDIS